MELVNQNPREFLSSELLRRLRANPRYSQRAFARQLGLSPGELSEILRGKRALSVKSAIKVAKSLGLNALEMRHLLERVTLASSGAPTSLLQLDSVNSSLPVDRFDLISEWYCFAILNLSECAGFRCDRHWISRKLGIKLAEAQSALDRLEQAGLLERTSAGKLRVVRNVEVSTAGASSESIRNYHRQILRKAMESMDRRPVADREIAGITLALNPAALEEFRQCVHTFLDEMGQRFSRPEKKTEVYQLEIALFPLTEEKTHA